VKIYIEGGGDSKELHSRCREAFQLYLQKVGVKKMPRLVAGGGRTKVFDLFMTASKAGESAMLWIDSEEPVENLQNAWQHLSKRDGWQAPAKAKDDEVILMVTSMETWIIADPSGVAAFYRDANIAEKLNRSVQRARQAVRWQVRQRQTVLLTICGHISLRS
jgi:hypothetical protein